ncbi:MAG: TonB-dependent receptor plug domain-containing protein [Gemmatimonadetes bacterium]|nr:TonB-dependent receptor plug domain-containing protein [Gemmatimonadota bacterium]
MTAEWRTLAFALGLATACATAAPVLAQDTTTIGRDTVVGPDTVPTAPAPLPPFAFVPEPEVPPGPLPPGSRYTFTRDSLAWTNALTLSDLLTAIPGVYVARGGFVGQSEYVVFAGRGAAALELYWDGMPMLPVGGDSLYADVARIYLTYLKRVDVELLPASMRVYLVSERHETFDDRSLVRVMSGDYSSTQYAGLFQKRWPAGVGIGLAANNVSSNGFSGTNRSDRAFDVWARLDWQPTARVGAVYQIRRQNQERDAVTLAGGGIGAPGRQGIRTDAQFRVFARMKPRGDGLGVDFLLGSSGWGGDSIVGERGVHLASASLRYSAPRMGVELTGRVADRRAVRTVAARAGVAPLPGLVLSGHAQADHLVGNRSSRRAHGAAALFRGPFSVVGAMSWGEAVQAPALRADPAQRTSDRSLHLGIDLRPVAGHVGIANRDAYQPLAFPDLPAIPRLGRSPESTVFIAAAKLQPIRSLTFDGWYVNPTRGGADFQPPTHGRAQVTFRSKFWRTFRSGAFDLKLQVAMESWSRGTAGLTAAGSVIALPGISFYEAYVSFQIVGFIAFWDLRNAYNSREPYVPGMPYPRNAQTFGVRWEFFN